MAHANNIITAPVDVYGDIAALFGIASGDVGYLIANASINKWPKYKPIAGGSVASLTDADRISLNQGFVVSSGNANSIYHSAPELAFNYAKTNGADWVYIHNNLSYYRVTDFVPYNPSSVTPYAGNGYDHSASTFIEPVSAHVNNVVGNTWQCGVQFRYKSITNGIALSDLAVFNNVPDATWYWGVVYEVGNTKGYAVCTTSQGGSTKLAVGSPSSSTVGVDAYFDIPVSNTTTMVEFYLCAICLSNVTSGLVGILYMPSVYDADFNWLSYYSPSATADINWWTSGGSSQYPYMKAMVLYQSSGYFTKMCNKIQVIVPASAYVSGLGGTLTVKVRNKSSQVEASPVSVQFTIPAPGSGDYSAYTVVRFDDFTIPTTSNTAVNLQSIGVTATNQMEMRFELVMSNTLTTIHFDGNCDRQDSATWTDVSDVLTNLTSRNYMIVQI